MMSRNEEMVKFVESSFGLEGMRLSASEKRTMMDCLNGKVTFNEAVRAALVKHRNLAMKSLEEMTPREHRELCAKVMEDIKDGRCTPAEDAYEMITGKEYARV